MVIDCNVNVNLKIKEGRSKAMKIAIDSFRVLEVYTKTYNKKYMSKDPNKTLHKRYYKRE